MGTKQAHPSLAEVARQAGVSSSTVSRVLNNTAPVSEDVRKQVLRASAELGYRHVPHRSVKTPPISSIALLIPDILNPFFAEIVRGVQDESADEYMPLLMDTAEDVQRNRKTIALMLPHRQDES
ncbi:MAG: LacI family transcriptional regulator, partial [Chloroflexi bacterium]|nr:LacI family transcriptional regulator [Chloroflexota bacterium]